MWEFVNEKKTSEGRERGQGGRFIAEIRTPRVAWTFMMVPTN
ncbi:hypothetical protein BX589_1198 [Paraburkholderia fungorum]|jgi:hypothetical protein|nr:hypothetical protein BX589_1198 [Paraburkholderia fungorum]